MVELAASGLSPKQAALMMELMASVTLEARPSVDAQAERRREKDRERKRAARPRNSADSAEGSAPPNDNISNPPSKPVSANADTAPFAERVVLAWNEMAGANGLAAVRGLSAARRKHLRARAGDHGEAAIFEAIRKLGASDWHCGRKEGSDWKADFNWLIESPKHFERILERADDATGRQSSPAFTNPEDWNRKCDEYAARFRDMGRENDAREWEGKRKSVEPRREATGPPRAIGALVEQMRANA